MALEPTRITIGEAAEIIAAAPLEIPIALWGDTGGGKTQGGLQVGEALDLPVLLGNAQITTPIDWMGLPVIERMNGKAFTRFTQPLILPQPEVHGERGIYFFDELPNATRMVQSAIQSLLTRGEYNGYVWPKGWKQIVAGNELTHRANTYEMPRPVANRLMHLHIRYDLDAWQEWAAGEKLTAKISAERAFPSIMSFDATQVARIHPLVRSYLATRPEHLHHETEGMIAFATPRTWEYTSHVLRLGLDEALQYKMLEGLIGSVVASEFQTYLGTTGILPQPRELLEGKAKLEKKHLLETGRSVTILHINGTSQELNASQLHAVALALPTGLKVTSKGETNRDEVRRFFEVIDQFASADYEIIAVRDLMRRVPEIQNMTEIFLPWSLRRKEYVR